MPGFQFPPAALLVAALVSMQACAPTAVAAVPPSHDQLVPPSEPRAGLRVELDLPRTATCEEDFELALYADRAVYLVQWEGSREKCTRRPATIRYLSRRIDPQKLLERIRKLALSVRVLGHE